MADTLGEKPAEWLGDLMTFAKQLSPEEIIVPEFTLFHAEKISDRETLDRRDFFCSVVMKGVDFFVPEEIARLTHQGLRPVVPELVAGELGK